MYYDHPRWTHGYYGRSSNIKTGNTGVKHTHTYLHSHISHTHTYLRCTVVDRSCDSTGVKKMVLEAPRKQVRREARQVRREPVVVTRSSRASSTTAAGWHYGAFWSSFTSHLFLPIHAIQLLFPLPMLTSAGGRDEMDRSRCKRRGPPSRIVSSGGPIYFLYMVTSRVWKTTLRKLLIILQASSVLPHSKKLKADFKNANRAI